MMELEDLLAIPPYSLEKKEKAECLTCLLKRLTEGHRERCPEYRKITEALGYNENEVKTLEDIPFIPVRLFKEYDLYSLPKEQISLTMTSSGTTGQQVSRIALDAETSRNQKKVLSHIITSYIGKHRLPLLILDSKKTLRDRRLFGARGAGILGFSILGRNVEYALDENMNLDFDAVNMFLEKHEGEQKLLFGYTFMIWQHVYLPLKEKGQKLDFGAESTLFHIGGWKKLRDIAVTDAVYKDALRESCNIHRIYNYYGMAEQLGSVYVECEYGHMHASDFSDIIIRNPLDFSAQPIGKKGLIELVSTIPRSYPGHAILTEDEGIILGEDDCPCGRKGKYFKILGRVKNAEIRGCSDTYADRLSKN